MVEGMVEGMVETVQPRAQPSNHQREYDLDINDLVYFGIIAP